MALQGSAVAGHASIHAVDAALAEDSRLGGFEQYLVARGRGFAGTRANQRAEKGVPLSTVPGTTSAPHVHFVSGMFPLGFE